MSEDKSDERRKDVLEDALKLGFEREVEYEEILDILGETIKFDDVIKTVVFLGCLVTFTEKEQINILITGESSIGKTYCVAEVLNFFSKDIILKKHGITPTAFFYDDNRILVDRKTLELFELEKPNKEDPNFEQSMKFYRQQKRNCVYLQDLERKIIWLPDSPDVRLWEKLRSLLSKDDKLFSYCSTNPSKYGLSAKEVLIRGFTTFIICTSSAFLDEQEATRCFLLNPTWSKEKEDACLSLINKRESGPEFHKNLENNPKRVWLKERIKRCQEVNINEIFISDELSETLRLWFQLKSGKSAPKNTRQYERVRSLAKAWCLFNFPRRKRDEFNNLYCDKKDVEVAMKIYEPLVECGSFNLSQEEYNFFLTLKKQYDQTNTPIKISDAHAIFYNYNGRKCSDRRLRNMLENFCREGLMRKEKESNAFKYYIIDYEKKEDGTIIPLFNYDKQNSVDKRKVVLEIFLVPQTIPQAMETAKQKGILDAEKIIQELINTGQLSEPSTGIYQKV